ncbi:MAG: nitrilase-related carbon-nitrogen hydrolase [Thermoanaerobaculia bacterium]|jgi:NAD+ synthase (glutamine-hydrolysing)
MKFIKVAAAVLNQTPLDWEGNKRNILGAIAESRRLGATVCCLPELSICGYGCEDEFHAPGVHEMSWRMLSEILPATHGMVVCLGLPVVYHNAIFNAAALVVDGKLLGIVGKRNLAGDGIHYEPRWFKPWPAGKRVEITGFDGRQYPFGDVYFDCGGITIGFEICEDAWVASRPGALLAREGVDMILNPSASHFAFGKMETRKRFVLEGSRAFGTSYVYSNLVGNEAGRAIYDGGAMIASSGKMLAVGPRFTFADWHVTTAVINVSQTRQMQARTGSFVPDLDDVPGERVRVEFAWPEVEPEFGALEKDAWERSAHHREEEFTRAESLALFDYMRKSRSRGYVVSLSGGADSSACAVLVRTMCELGVAELGAEGFVQKLGRPDALKGKADVEAMMPELLACAYQSTRNSSSSTRDSAAAVASGTGARFFELDVDAFVQQYVTMVGGALGRELAWERDDIALQNVQARVRVPGIWLIANLRGAILLATSNRSEAAVGYATMDGDTSGGLSPLAGIDKAFIRTWLRWMEIEGPAGLHPFACLAPVNALAPTAELRPASAHQTDEDDLMPYPLLDAIERAAIRDKQMPIEVFRMMRRRFPEYDAPTMHLWVDRFFRLWSRNQWKRERYAPSFHLDDANLDPKTWCRFPILSGGFEKELEELRVYVEKKG